jgi:3',5'-cyclic AMP phosphodiesterase CpdA
VRNSPVTRRHFVTGLGAFVSAQLLVPSIMRGAPLSRELKPLRLGFLTDCHAMFQNDAPVWLEQTARLMNSLQPDLIIGGGDFVDGGFYLPGRVMEQRWKLADAFLRKIDVRMEPVIGNHDFYEPLTSDGSPSPTDPRWRFRKFFGLGKTYRSFEFQGYRFLILDSVKVVGGPDPYRGWIDAAQLLWLDDELKKIPANQPIILCTHIPFKTNIDFGFGSLIGPSPGRLRVLNADLVMEKLRDRPLALILQGHLHINEHLQLGGVPCITGGAVCGNWWKGPNMGTYPGIGIIEITPNQDRSIPEKSVTWNYTNTPAPKKA